MTRCNHDLYWYTMILWLTLVVINNQSSTRLRRREHYLEVVGCVTGVVGALLVYGRDAQPALVIGPDKG